MRRLEVKIREVFVSKHCILGACVRCLLGYAVRANTFFASSQLIGLLAQVPIFLFRTCPRDLML